MEYIENKSTYYKYIYQNCHCCNAGQSPDERRLKYAIAISFGKCATDARKLRDWNKNPFAKFFGYSSWDSLIKSL